MSNKKQAVRVNKSDGLFVLSADGRAGYQTLPQERLRSSRSAACDLSRVTLTSTAASATGMNGTSKTVALEIVAPRNVAFTNVAFTNVALRIVTLKTARTDQTRRWIRRWAEAGQRVALKLSGLTVILLCAGLLAPTTHGQDLHDFKIARVKYAGGGDWYGDPESLTELLKFVRSETLLDVAPEEDVVELSSDKLFSYPYVYITGHGNIKLSDSEAHRLRRYLLGGGFLHIDDNYGLDAHIRRELGVVFPDRELVEVPFSHPIYHTHFEFPGGLPKIHEHDGKPPQGFGLFDDNGRLMLFYSYETDLGDGWEPEEVHNDPPELRLAALRMGANILSYAMLF